MRLIPLFCVYGLFVANPSLPPMTMRERVY